MACCYPPRGWIPKQGHKGLISTPANVFFYIVTIHNDHIDVQHNVYLEPSLCFLRLLWPLGT